MTAYRARLMRLTALAVLVWPFAVPAAYRTGDLVLQREPVTTDIYLAGRTIDVLGQVDSDVVAAGQRFSLNAPAGADVTAVGETVELNAPVADDVRAAGRAVLIGNRVGGHVVAAGADVQLGAQARVADWAWLAGMDVLVAGSVGAGLKAAGNRVVVAGEVRGDAEITAQTVELRDGARIAGDLIVRSETQPTIADGAVVEGRVIVEPPPAGAQRDRDSPFSGIVVFALLLAITAGTIYLLFPGFAHAAAGEARGGPLKTLGLGLTLVVGVPILVLVLVLTGVGALLGLTLLALYLAALVIGFCSGIFIVGDIGLRLARRRCARRGIGALAVVLAAIVVALLSSIPVLGGLMVFLLLLAGSGGLLLRLWRHYHTGAPAT